MRVNNCSKLKIYLLALVICLIPIGGWAAEPRRLSVVIFPTENSTGLEVWESKYYPYNVLERKMTDYLEMLFKHSPLIDVRVLDEQGMNRWISDPHRTGDMAVQMELYGALLKDREIMGKVETGKVNLRLRVFDAVRAEQFAMRTISGKDKRYTFGGEDNVFLLDAVAVSLPFPFKDGLDIFGLTSQRDKGQKMSRYTWNQFQSTPYWQAFKNAINEVYFQAMAQDGNAIRRNEPDAEELGQDYFYSGIVTVGRIVSPTENSKRKRREYIITLGRQALGPQDSVRVGDILEVMRGDVYSTVDPENPIALLAMSKGKVKVIKVQEKNAVVVVIQDKKKDPIQLKDLVIKVTKVIDAKGGRNVEKENSVVF